MHLYLQSTEYIDWQHPAVLAKARELAAGRSGRIEIARRCFEFVRDGIRHSWDYRINPVTCKATVEEVYRNLPDVELLNL